MKTRSPSVDRICAAAVIHFAERGYDASSLNDIAELVGIRKASLYAHFSSKNALFMEVFDDALSTELVFVDGCFAAKTTSALPGAKYCTSLAKRYAQSPHLQFLLRTAFLPPQSLKQEVSTGYQAYLERLLTSFTAKLQTSAETKGISHKDVALFGQAYLGIVDSLHVEMVYAGESNLANRWKAFQRILADSLACSVNAAKNR